MLYCQNKAKFAVKVPAYKGRLHVYQIWNTHIYLVKCCDIFLSTFQK